MTRARDIADLGAVTSRLDTVGASDGALSHRRMTYNGAMNVWQRGTSADTASAGDYMCDRWYVTHSGLDGNVDWDQETSSTPEEFPFALKISMDASETSLDAVDYLIIGQKFEGQDLQHLLKGTANAKKVTVSFWVKSSVASTYTLEWRDDDNNRNNHRSYTIDAADTWEYKTITFDGDTSSADPFDNDANHSMSLVFWIDAGSTFTSGTFSTAWQNNDSGERVYDTTGWLESTSPTFYITGVQLEVGDTATPFEHRSYGDELARCQRYYEKYNSRNIAYAPDNVNGNSRMMGQFTATKRAQPSMTATGSWVLNASIHSFEGYVGTAGNNYYPDWQADAEL